MHCATLCTIKAIVTISHYFAHTLTLTHSLIHPSGAGGALLDRLCRPLTTDPTFRSLNENTKRSLGFIRERLEDLERKGVELSPALSQQETLLRDFLTYCEFEQTIEQV